MKIQHPTRIRYWRSHAREWNNESFDSIASIVSSALQVRHYRGMDGIAVRRTIIASMMLERDTYHGQKSLIQLILRTHTSTSTCTVLGVVLRVQCTRKTGASARDVTKIRFAFFSLENIDIEMAWFSGRFTTFDSSILLTNNDDAITSVSLSSVPR